MADANSSAVTEGQGGAHARNDVEDTAAYEMYGWVRTGIAAEARTAADHELSMTLKKALRLYPRACFWSCVVSLVVIMDGYDTALIGSMMGFPAFRNRFGVPTGATHGYQVEAKWQTALGLASPIGNVVGIFVNAELTERFGHKKMLLATLGYLTGCIFIVFFAQSVEMLFAGEVLCGLAWGVFTTLSIAYASEVTPVVLRAYLETFVVLCWGIGQLIAFGTLEGLSGNVTQWAWRIPFAVQWVWPVIIFPLASFAPESPWWLVRKGRLQAAEKSVRALSSMTDPDAARNTVALMVETTELERTMAEGISYWECFRGTNLWRTEICCVSWLAQVLVGFAITSYAAYFFEQAGLSAADSYKLTAGQGGLHFVCVCLSVFITARHGRRDMFIWGCLWMSAMMWIIAFLALPTQTTGIGYGSAAVYLLWYSGYELTIGPVSFIIVSETSSTRLRSHTISLARNAYNVFNIASFCVAPYVLNPTAGDWKGKTAFLAAGFALLAAVWGFFRLPECKGRTFEEVDILFSKNLKPWQFSSYKIDRRVEVEAKLTDFEHIE